MDHRRNRVGFRWSALGDGHDAIEKDKETMKTSQESLTSKLLGILRRRRRVHDRMLVLNLSIFNFDDGWNRTLSRGLKVRENVT
jgi:hypothetical protein